MGYPEFEKNHLNYILLYRAYLVPTLGIAKVKRSYERKINIIGIKHENFTCKILLSFSRLYLETMSVIDVVVNYPDENLRS